MEAEEISLFGQIMGDYGIMLSLIMIGLAVVGVVLGTVLGFIRDTSNIKGTLIGLVGFVVILAIAYFMASDVMPKTSLEPEKLESITSGTVKRVSAGIYAFYLLFFLAIGSAVFSEVSKFFK